MHSHYKILVENRYTDYKIIDSTDDSLQDITLKPLENSLFNFDVFSIDASCNVTVEHSIVRNHKYISGILKLSSSTTYGKKGKKTLYKCIPDDNRLPYFKIPYSIKYDKNNRLLTKTTHTDKYITFKFIAWDNDERYPTGEIIENIGDVTKLENYYEYQLYCNSLYTSTKNFNKITIERIHETTTDDIIKKIDKTNQSIEDRTSRHIITIDPPGSKDYDDAIGLYRENDEIIVSIYITNVSIWLNALDLWSSFSKRIATIYLPNRKRPMLPTILSDNICSLKEDNIRYAFTLDITIDNSYTIKETRFCNTKLKVAQNYTYEEDNLCRDICYNELLSTVSRIKQTENHTFVDTIDDSHELISYLMILMNYYSSHELCKYKNGIFRTLKFNDELVLPTNLSKECRRYIKIWNSNGSKYVLYNNDEKSHDMLKFNDYVHITSPIRRLVDLLNILQLQDNLGFCKLYENNRKFLNYWTSDTSINYINDTMRSIRKVQNNCSLLHKYEHNKSIFDNEHIGYIIDKMHRNDDSIQYITFISKLKVFSKFISYEHYNLYDEGLYKLYYFQDKDTLKRKIRVQLLQ
jgi:exoribonuclease R